MDKKLKVNEQHQVSETSASVSSRQKVEWEATNPRAKVRIRFSGRRNPFAESKWFDHEEEGKKVSGKIKDHGGTHQPPRGANYFYTAEFLPPSGEKKHGGRKPRSQPELIVDGGSLSPKPPKRTSATVKRAPRKAAAKKASRGRKTAASKKR